MKKENLPVLIAIGLPVLLIVIVACLVLFRNNVGRPQYNFLYTETRWPYAYSYQGSECTVYENYYEIEGTHLMMKSFNASSTPRDPNGNPMPAPAAYCGGYARVVARSAPTLYIYDSASDTSKSISYDEAAKLTLVDGVISPDGYTVSGSYQDAGIFDLFGGNDGYGLYAMKQGRRVRLSVVDPEAYNTGDFGFLAWISK